MSLDINNYPKEIKSIARQVRKQGWYSMEMREKMNTIIQNDGWLYGILYFRKPISLEKETDIVNLSSIQAEFATLEYENGLSKYIPLYTSENYANNLSDIVKPEGFSYRYCCKIRILDMLQRAKQSSAKGLIINPQVEGLLIFSSQQNTH